MSAEIQSDVSDQFSTANNDIEPAVNTALAGTDFGSGFSSLVIIHIIRLIDHPDYPEVRRYHKKDKDFEFRLKIRHADFKAAGALGQRRLLMENILRAVDEMKKMAVKDVEVDKLERAIREVAAAHDWLPATRSN